MIKTAARTVDPITFEIISHRLYEITREMGMALERVSGTTTTTQMKDYVATLYRPNGDVLTVGHSGLTQFAVCAGFAVKKIIERFEKEGEIFPDDMFLLNDPYVAAIHQSDVFIISPIHYEGQLAGWSATFVHVMDIGAMSPGGFSPDATEICHEGVRIAGIKLVERGKLKKDVFDAVINMTRQPVMVGLDLKSQIAANNVAKSRMQDMIKKYGPELIGSVSSEMIRYTEGIFRRRIQEIPDGSWSEKAQIQADDTWKMNVTLTKKDNQLIFDFTGSDKQARRGINLPYHATFGNCFSVVLSILGYDILRNQGAFYPITVIAPPGTLVNVQSPGPVSLNTTSGQHVVRYLAASVLVQAVATSEKWKHEVMAQKVGGRMARHAGVNQYGGYYASTFSDASGNGATSYKDGVSSANFGMNVSNVEWQELNFPVLYLFRRHLTDGGGAGKFRGGPGLEITIKVHDAKEGKIKGIALGVAGLNNSGQGLFGGYPGVSSILSLLKGTRVEDMIAENKTPVTLADLGGKAELLGYCEFDIQKNDVLYIRTNNGGGFGDPLEREPQNVLSDLRDGLISEEMAKLVYGVALDRQNNTIDLAATQNLRQRLIQERIKGFEASLAVKQESAIRHGGSPLETDRLSGVEGLKDGTHPRPGVTHPFRDSLELHDGDVGTWVRCSRCLHVLCLAKEDWRKACGIRRLPPTKAGPLMREMSGILLLEQLFCPSCGILFDTYLVEEKKDA